MINAIVADSIGRALSIQGVTKRFGRLQVLNELSLRLPAGQRVALIGPSGSGKTTILRCVAMLEPIDAGTITVDDRIINSPGRHKRRYDRDLRTVRTEIGMVFQHFNLFPNMTALGNVTLAPVKVLRVSKAEAQKQGRAILASVGLADKADSYPAQLSGGQQQRVAIARALAMRPSILLFDEVTSALDPELVGEVLAVIRLLASETNVSMIIATHEMSFAAEIADHVVFLEEGLIVEEGPPQQVLKESQNDRTRQFLRRIELP